LKDKQTVLNSLSLAGDAVSTNGHIDARSLLAEISPYLGQRQDLKLIRFREFLHHLEVHDGRYYLSDLRLHGLDTDWWGEGWLGFDGNIDMRLAVKLPANFKPDLGDLSFLAEGLRGEDGRIKLDLHMTGRSSQPVVKLLLAQAKEKAQQDVQEEVKKGVEGLLDKLRRK
jgi:hypothetical protein